MKMNEDHELELKALSEFMTIRDAKGRTALTIGLIATVYFKNPCTQLARQAVADVAERYIAEFRKDLVWAQHDSGPVHRIDSNKVPTPGAWILQLPEGGEWSLGFYGGGRVRRGISFRRVWSGDGGSEGASRVFAFPPSNALACRTSERLPDLCARDL